MHKRAKERMVLTRGGIRKLSPELQDETAEVSEDPPSRPRKCLRSSLFPPRSEFFLPLLLHGRFVCELTADNEVLVRFKENEPVQPADIRGFPALFTVVASKGLLTSQTVDILRRISVQISRESQIVHAGGPCDVFPRRTSPICTFRPSLERNEPRPLDHRRSPANNFAAPPAVSSPRLHLQLPQPALSPSHCHSHLLFSPTYKHPPFLSRDPVNSGLGVIAA